ncbi:MAG: hypothetical protein AAF384_06015 [Pseudomonadota bacterium]
MGLESQQDFEATLASALKVLALAIHDGDPSQLLVAQRLVQKLNAHEGASCSATRSFVKQASELLNCYIHHMTKSRKEAEAPLSSVVH